MTPTQRPSQKPRATTNSSIFWANSAVRTKAASVPIRVPTARHQPLPTTAPCTGLISNSTVDAAENGESSCR
ncbi:hypothetical protein M770_33965 (plasmid) [Pseudomonas aeruginosa VRFPA03]|nr:hypothetical protein M770_33965 [Pseudomonas aeruginosa VRFPA03]